YDSEDPNPPPTWAPFIRSSPCGSSYVTERVGDQGTAITIYGANGIEGYGTGGNTEITLDDTTETISNRSFDLSKCYPEPLFWRFGLENKVHTGTVTLLSGTNGTDLLYIMDIEWCVSIMWDISSVWMN
ncbi:hypothetical protein FRC03_011903, partial [Tulasnella sp. 419]